MSRETWVARLREYERNYVSQNQAQTLTRKRVRAWRPTLDGGSTALVSKMAEAVDAKLENICSQLKKGVAPPNETVRSFLLWFGGERRGWHVVRRIRLKLNRYGLETVPDFEYEYLDGQIGFAKKKGTRDAAGSDLGFTERDPIYRIGRLQSANVSPISIKPDSTLQQAITLMLAMIFPSYRS